ncbi:MAG: glycosyltransferase family 2 protein [Cetobacterium sp.]|uniref:glycosyltransferase family 2 protein n=1 Tax=Cetobacterium sp. TaxID=2071632 RepID=UPI003EE617DE
MKKVLTVFTPTYNRAYVLNGCYQSLLRQTCQDFIWVIIDDGSTDNTTELVKSWIDENKIEIRYYYQENKGMHGAHNKAYEVIDTELNVCIDSDDYMTDNAVEIILNVWEKNKRDDIAGIGALDIYKNGEIIGTKFPEGLKETKYFDIFKIHKVKGDKKFIYRTELVKQNPYPIFYGEKYVGLDYKYMKLDEDYSLVLINEAVCIVEYLQDGSSLNMFRQYKNNPKGFAFYRIENMKNKRGDLKYRFKESIHYVASSLISKNTNFFKETPCKMLCVLALPFGYIFYKCISKKGDESWRLIWKYFISQ